MQHICDETEIVGVNNRDLKTFTVDINRSIELSKKIPADKIKIAESGINDIETICIFKNAGFKGFLIGENFMKQPDPTIAFADFVTTTKSKRIMRVKVCGITQEEQLLQLPDAGCNICRVYFLS